MSAPIRVLALSGGIGGAKLALGLTHAMAPERLMIAANPGDDFEHLGLTICPDLDTLTYTLSGLSDREKGWGRAGESWNFLAALDAFGGETWFQLGDKDLALHIARAHRLASGESLSAITGDICRRLGIAAHILPATDAPLRTIVETPEGPLPFQRYFVERRAAPVVTGFTFDGAAAALPSPALAEVLAGGMLEAIVVCPSNPYISIDPILAIPGLRDALRGAGAPIVAVSPIVGGTAIKGPTAKMMRELGRPVSVQGIAAHYGDLLDGLVIDEADREAADELRAGGLKVAVAQTVMRSDADKAALGEVVLWLAGRCRGAE